MSDRVLTKDELDALMTGISAGVDEYDANALRERFAGNRLGAIENVSDRFCGSFTRSLFSFLRSSVDVTAGGVASMKYSDFVETKDLPASFNIFHLPPLMGSGMLVLEAELIFALLSSSFGGAANKPADVEGREFTLFEKNFIKKIAEMVFMDMESAWKPLVELEFNLDRSETNLELVDAALASEMVLVSTFHIEMESLKSSFSICIPYSGVEPLEEKFGVSLADIISPAENIKQLGK